MHTRVGVQVFQHLRLARDYSSSITRLDALFINTIFF